ncbi:MAG: single-stranded DNA-binding protein [Bacteroidales bacterium]|jgi:single-strand DNA-binding protein|nr:single-stranded DNA-binding protein [Bacteroidales bacterium]
MAGVNKVILIGNLGKDPDIMIFDGVKKATFSLATSETYKNKEGQKLEQTEWHNIVCWRGLADIAEKFLKKGVQVYIEGRLRYRKWEDKEGRMKHVVEIVADNFMILTRTNNIDHINNNHSEPGLSNILEEYPNADSLGDLPF